MAWGSEGSPHVCFRFVWYTCVIFIPVHFQKEYSSSKGTPVLHTAFYWPRIPAHQTKLKKCEGQRRSLWQWRTAQPEAGDLFLTCKPSFGRCDLSTIPSAHWPKGPAVALFKSEEWENAKAQSPFFVNPLWGFQSCNQVIIAWLTIWTEAIKWFFDCLIVFCLLSLIALN